METYKEGNVYPNEVREEVQNADEIDPRLYDFLNDEEDEIHIFNQNVSNKTLPKFVAHQQKKRDIIMDDASSVPSKKVSKESTVVTSGSYKSDITDSDFHKLDSFSENQSYYNNSSSSQSYNYSSSSQTTRADLMFHTYLQNKYSGNIVRSSNGQTTIEKFAFADMDKLEKVLEEVPQSRLLGYV